MTARETVLKFMRRTPRVDISTPDIVKATGITHVTVGKVLRHLRDEGLVERGKTINAPAKPPTTTWRTVAGASGTGGPVRVMVPQKEDAPPKRGRRTRHLLEFLHASTVMLVKM